MVRLVTRTIISIFYSLKVKGTENVLRGGNSYIIASNHINWFDGFVLIALFKDKITFSSTSYLFERPIVGGFLIRMGSISVSQIKTRRAIKKALNILKNGGKIGIFPEGGKINKRDAGSQARCLFSCS